MMEGDVERVFCSICNGEFGSINPAVKVGEAGLTTLVKRAKEKDVKELYKISEAKLNQEIVENVYVHHDCRRYVDKQKNKASNEQKKKMLRSSDGQAFNWRLDCFLCEKRVYDGKKCGQYSVSQVCTLPIRETLIERCKKRTDD